MKLNNGDLIKFRTQLKWVITNSQGKMQFKLFIAHFKYPFGYFVARHKIGGH